MKNISNVIQLDSPQPHIFRVTLNRPDRLNAFDTELKAALTEVMRGVTVDESIRVVVLRGAGRAFSVGADVKGKSQAGDSYVNATKTAADDYKVLRHGTIDTFLEVWKCPVPVIAQVHGYCMGIGLILAACCDLIVCADDAVFGWPAVPLGGGMIGPIWAHHIGSQKARELSYTTGSRVSGREAVDIGMAVKSVPQPDLESTVLRMTGHMARISRDLLSVKKAAFNHMQNESGFEETLRLGAAWDALGHETDIVAEIRARIVAEGLKSVIADWAPPERGER